MSEDRDGLEQAATVASSDALAPTITPAPSRPGAVHLEGGSLETEGFADRYRTGRVLGRGGMGEVRLLRDDRIGREVAMKVMRDPVRDDVRARFLREARVQGQLEHPAIVPVYDLGLGPDGAPYFTMKRLRGVTLEKVIASGELAERRMLAALVTVCQALEYAHTRGVLHRDLKPGNVMLGDFGETYVLDWGVARIAGTPDEEGGLPLVSPGETAAGSILGTPGYMAPEQARGEPVDERADVYSLGCMLFEVLARRPLHPRATALESTLAGARVRFEDREVAPELEAICVRATALDPGDRFPSVAALVAALQAYLDGDRDLARRRELAAEHVTAARVARERPVAMREASRALAMDPENEEAAGIITRLMLEPPETVPAEVQASVERSLAAASRLEARTGALAYLGYLAFTPLFIWMGVRDWGFLAALGVLQLVLCGQALLASRSERLEKPMLYSAVVLNAIFLMMMSRFFGPFIVLPVVAAASAIAFVFHGHVLRPAFAIASSALIIAVPVALEGLGLIQGSYLFTDGGMVLAPNLVSLPETATRVTLLILTTGSVVATALFVLSVRKAQLAAEERLHLQSWYLRHLVPESAHPALDTPSSSSSSSSSAAS
jgi:eukaryotic-like serine/threonine-protein kinase